MTTLKSTIRILGPCCEGYTSDRTGHGEEKLRALSEAFEGVFLRVLKLAGFVGDRRLLGRQGLVGVKVGGFRLQTSKGFRV